MWSLWANQRLRKSEWIPSRSPPDPLLKSCDLPEPLIGLERSAPDLLPIRSQKINRFLTFESIGTSDESDVLKRKMYYWQSEKILYYGDYGKTRIEFGHLMEFSETWVVFRFFPPGLLCMLLGPWPTIIKGSSENPHRPVKGSNPSNQTYCTGLIIVRPLHVERSYILGELPSQKMVGCLR